MRWEEDHAWHESTMFKGLSGLKKAVKGGINVVSEHTSQLAEQVKHLA